MDPYIRALMEDGLEEVLADELEWTASQGEELMDSDDEAELLSAARRSDQQGGNPLFCTNMERLGAPRSFHNGVAVQHHVRFRLNQMRAPNGDPQGEAVAEALRQRLENYVRREQSYPVEDYSLKISIHHSSGTHTWIGSPILPLADWLNNREQTEAWLDKLAKQLNSAESFDAASGDFYAELLFFKNRQRGSGHRGKKGNPGAMSYEQILKKKHCIVYCLLFFRSSLWDLRVRLLIALRLSLANSPGLFQGDSPTWSENGNSVANSSEDFSAVF